jgi:hypothetical protein
MSTTNLQGASVAGNVNTEFVTPAGTQRRILYGLAKLTTDATVANRWVRLSVLNESGETMVCLCAGVAVAASATNQLFSYLQGVYRETSFINGVLQVPIASDLIVPAGYTVRLAVENGVAGDSYNIDLVAEDTHVGARV